MQVIINIIDVNDNRPMFSQDAYQVTINESVQGGTSILSFNITDNDMGIYGVNGLVCYLRGVGSEKYLSIVTFYHQF